MKCLYQASATATGGREGSVATVDGALALSLAMPAALGGSGGEGHNPEQLFAACYSASFLSAMRFVAGMKEVAFPETGTVTVTVGVGRRRNGQGFGLDIALSAHLPGLDRATAEGIVLMAHAACAYSHAIRTGFDVKLSIA